MGFGLMPVRRVQLPLLLATTFLWIASLSLARGQTLQTLYSFPASLYPGRLAMGNDGNLYGTTTYGGITNAGNTSGMGTVFRLTTNGAFLHLASLATTNGTSPNGLTLGPDGNLYRHHPFWWEL